MEPIGALSYPFEHWGPEEYRFWACAQREMQKWSEYFNGMHAVTPTKQFS